MAKKIIKKIKLRIEAGKATPAPPLGPALGQAGINIGDFVSKFNEASKKMAGEKIGVVLTVYEDRTYSFVIKTPSTAALILKAAGIEKGSGKPPAVKVGKITRAQIRAIAEQKIPDLNTKDIERAVKIVEGSAKSMGVEITD